MDIWGMSVAGRKKQLHWIRGQILSNMSNENQADIRKHIKIRLMGSSGWEIDAWCQFSSFPSLSLVRLFVTPRTTAQQASPSITNSQSPPKPMSIELVMPSNHLILCHPLLLLPSISSASGSFQMSQLFASGGQSIGVSASTSVLPMNTQD